MTKGLRSPQILTAVEAQTSREFLRIVFDEQKNNGRKLTYASLARLAGFASRSFPRDVIKGIKLLSRDSALAMARALKLNSDLAAYLCYLVERDGLLKTTPNGLELKRVE
ncbi:MAG: hypothetical protein EOP04_17010, partial [Proteobacteria bacterium]